MPATTAPRSTTEQQPPAAEPPKGKGEAAGVRMREEPEPPFPRQEQPRPGIEADMEPRPRYALPTYRAAGKLEGKVAIVTGGDSGIGRAVAVLFAREGADVAIAHLHEEQKDAEETRSKVEEEGRRCLTMAGDVGDAAFCRDLVARVVEEFGHLDILVNNAAFQQHHPRFEDVSEEQWERTFRTNITGYFLMAKAALPHLKEGAAIINNGSITGLEGHNQLIDYASTKGAIHAFTKSLALNLADRGIRVNCVAPGPVWTPLNVSSDKPQERVERFGEDTPMGRAAQPEEIAPAFVFFASEPDSSYISGEVLTLLGGRTRAG